MHGFWIINEQITFDANVLLSYVNELYYVRWCRSGSLVLDQIRIWALSIDDPRIQTLTIDKLKILTIIPFPDIDKKRIQGPYLLIWILSMYLLNIDHNP